MNTDWQAHYYRMMVKRNAWVDRAKRAERDLSEMRADRDRLDKLAEEWQETAEMWERACDESGQRQSAQIKALENTPRGFTAEDMSGIVRVVVIGPNGTEYERGDLYSNGAHLVVQDYGHTLKIFPNPPDRDPRAEELEADLRGAEEPEMDDEDRRLISDHLAALGWTKEN